MTTPRRRQMRSIQTKEEFRIATGGRLPTPPRLVISEWLKLCQAGQWTPFEAAGEVIRVLSENGYQIVPEKK